MKAKDLMSVNPEVISPEMTLQEAAKKMREQDFGFLPIGENDRLIGTITDRDIVIRGVAEGKDANKTLVREVMTEEIRYCFENDSIEIIADTMSKKQIRRLAVLNDNKRIVGVVSLGDVATKCNNSELSGNVTTAVSEE